MVTRQLALLLCLAAAALAAKNTLPKCSICKGIAQRFNEVCC
jgi:hypothetical protein